MAAKQVTDPGAEGSGSVKAGAPKRRRRLLLWIGGGLLLIILALIALPPLIVPGIVRSKLLAALDEAGYPQSKLADVGFSWPGSLTLGGLEIRDRKDRLHVTVPKAAGRVRLGSLLSGPYDAELEVADARVEMREKPPRKPGEPEEKEPPEKKEPPQKEKSRLPDMKVRVTVTRASLLFVAHDGARSEFQDIGASVVVDGLEKPVAVAAKIPWPGGQFALDAALSPFRDGRVDVPATSGKINYRIEALDLARIAPIARAYSGIDALRGKVDGGGQYELLSLTSPSGESSIVVQDLGGTGGPLGPRPMAIPKVTIKDAMVRAGEGVRQTSEVDAPGVVRVSWQGGLPGAGGERRQYDGTLAMNADLDGLGKAAPGLLRLKEGTRLAGQAKLDARLGCVTARDAYESASANATLEVNGLQAFDQSGRQVPIDPTLTAGFEMQHAASGVAKVPTARLKMGSLDLDASGGFDVEHKTLSPTNIKARADLDDLASKFGAFLDLPVSFGGKLEVDARAEGRGEAANATARATMRGFRLAKPDGFSVGPFEVTLDGRGMVDPAAAWATKIEQCEIKADGAIQPAGGGAPLRLSGLVMSLAGTLGGEQTVADLSEVRVRCARLETGGAAGAPPSSIEGLDARAACTLRGGNLAVRDLTIESGGLRGKGSGTVQRVSEADRVIDGKLELRGDVGPTLALAGAFAPAARDWRGSGAWEMNSAITRSGTKSTIKTTMRAPDISLTAPPKPAAAGEPAGPPRTVRQQDLVVDADMDLDGGGGGTVLVARPTKIASRTGTAELQGTMRPGKDGGSDLRIVADAELARVFEDLAGFLDAGDYKAQGRAHLQASVAGSGGPMKIQGEATVADLVATVPAGKRGPARTLQEPRVVVSFDGEKSADGNSVSVSKLAIDSGILRGKMDGRAVDLNSEPAFQGVRGDFTYNPDKLGTLLDPWLPGKLSGTKDETISFTLDGKAKETDWVSVLRGSTGTGNVGLAPLAMAGVTLEGDVKMDVRDQKLVSTSKLDLNGGALALDGNMDLRPAPDAVSTVKANLTGASASGELAPLLALVNPILSLGDGGAGGALSALIDLNLALSYRGALEAKDFKGGWTAFPKERLDGQGRIAMKDLVVQGSNLVTQILQITGDGPSDKIDFEPIEFAIQGGRLAYAKPISMSISGVKMLWTGTIGLDKTLDLALEMPVTDKLARKHGALGSILGKGLRIPVGGTTSSPQIRFDQVLAEVAKSAITQGLEDKLGGKVGGLLEGSPLGGLLGGGKKPANPPPGQPSAEDEKKAQDLLALGDSLFQQGRVPEAGAQYKTIRDFYGATQVYKANKARIDERAR